MNYPRNWFVGSDWLGNVRWLIRVGIAGFLWGAGTVALAGGGANPLHDDKVILVPKGGEGVRVGPFVTPQGQPAKANTTAAISWDDRGLRIRFECEDARVTAQSRECDDSEIWKDDSVEVFLDINHTHHPASTWAHVIINAAGAVFDERGPLQGYFATGDPKGGDPKWNAAGLTTAVERSSTGWHTEIFLPWESLGGRPQGGAIWGLNLARANWPDEEYQCLTPTFGPFHNMDAWGHVVFTEDPLFNEVAAVNRVCEEHNRLRDKKTARPGQAVDFSDPPVHIYVAPDGRDDNPGTRIAPFATLQRARAAVRKLKAAGLHKGGVEVTIRGGVYRLDTSFALTAEDSGTVESPIVYRAAPGEQVRLTGGRRISEWNPVTDEAILKRLDQNIRRQVFQADLNKLNITNYGQYVESHWWGNAPGTRMEFFFDDRPMVVARWPNAGFTTLADVVDKDPKSDSSNPTNRGTAGCECGHDISHSGAFFYEGDRPRRWVGEKDMHLLGYWMFDWAPQRMAVENIDPERRIIALRDPNTHSYGYRKGQRYIAYNALCELDEPGEWFADRATGLLYFYPPKPLDKAIAEVSLTTLPLITLTDASYVSLRGLTLEAGQSDGLTVSGGEGVRVVGCVLRNLGAWAIRVSGGSDHGVIGCDVYETGEGGISLDDGDRATLTAANHFAENNHIHHYARWKRTYRPGLSLGGVGQRVANNLIHDAPHQAIGFSGNEHLIEYNEIHDVVTECNDSGAIYAGQDPTMQGTVIRYNYLHQIGGMKGHGVAGVYFDDGMCGNTVFGNVFHQACVPGHSGFGAVFVHGGKYHTIANNLFIDCAQAYNELPWEKPAWRKYCEGFRATMDVRKSVYFARYPWLAYLSDDPRPCILAHNLVVRCRVFREQGLQKLEGNLRDEDAIFVDDTGRDFQLRDESPALRKGFERIPFHRIGLIDDATRATWPVREGHRTERKPD